MIVCTLPTDILSISDSSLMVLNRRCVEAGVLTALALSCRVNPVSVFDRKHYFYADLPAGYQITQHRLPLAQEGELEFHVFIPDVHHKPYIKKSCIKQLQLEQDSGKLLHDEEACRSLVDLSRAGIPLMELVFEPDLEDGEEAAALVKELILILQCLGTCSCKMEEGALRVDANVSVHREGEPLGVRSEVKNIGSIRAVAHAVKYEIDRQVRTLESGGVVVNETRAWDTDSRQTVPMRDKEEKQDYRYMPEPNLPPLRVLLNGQHAIPDIKKDCVNVDCLRRKLPELPRETREKLINQYGISAESAVILVNENNLLKHFYGIMGEKKSRDPKLSTNILIMELLTILNKNKLSLETSPFSSYSLGEVVDLLQSKKVNLVTARKLLQEIVSGNPQSPSEMVEKYGWAQITDSSEIEDVCTAVIEQNPRLVEQFCAGKTKVFNSLVGKVAKITENRANMALVVKVLRDKLSKIQNS
ncbi:glutamyl-tRNA(Gln) amidotransferase subunit B, mitochondrial isoform X3 [Zootermopsis nevadensis]|uniref:glutamyl-tRNA(Gln) amidotransferase subunit B, mitochondrial isoform X3 n=1 Tax=Zootermopsis nevadensis TaxID=136037 RepID=UPI000B8ED3B5|nr:glutamyl-tRNA(Gln) amidotransferase subunit B, mitochondrial isoform X3 [Zootermopsis nevadensis]